MAGARWAQQFFQRHADDQLAAFLVWVKHLPTDAQNSIDPNILTDPRATRFWDPTEVSGRWLTSKGLSEFGFAWDIALVYGADAQLESPVRWYCPVIDHAEELETTLLQLLGRSG